MLALCWNRLEDIGMLSRFKRLWLVAIGVGLCSLLGGCAILGTAGKVVGTAGKVVGTAANTAIKTTGKVLDAVVPN